jgi:hypothetical protein
MEINYLSRCSLEQDSSNDGQKDRSEKGREDVGTNQKPDTLVAFVRNSKGCEDTHQPVRGGWYCHSEVFVPKEIIARRIQDIFGGPNKGRKTDHYLVVWEGYPLKKGYTWDPIENLYGHEDLDQTYKQWLKTENENLTVRKQRDRHKGN